jgi:large subunit ribosomal protein L29
MRARELREKTDSELLARVRELDEELFHLRIRRATAQLSNPMKVRETRRELARVRTVLRERVPRAGGAA